MSDTYTMLTDFQRKNWMICIAVIHVLMMGLSYFTMPQLFMCVVIFVFCLSPVYGLLYYWSFLWLKFLAIGMMFCEPLISCIGFRSFNGIGIPELIMLMSVSLFSIYVLTLKDKDNEIV